MNDTKAKILSNDVFMTADCTECGKTWSFKKGSQTHNYKIKHRLAYNFVCDPCISKPNKNKQKIGGKK